MKSKNQSSQRRKENIKLSSIAFSFDSISTTAKSSLLSSFPNYEKNILFAEQCDFQFQDSEYENGILVMTLHYIGLFIEQSKEQYKKIALFNILTLTDFVLSKESQQNDVLYIETLDFQMHIFSDKIIQISRVIFRNYTLSTLSMPKNQKIIFRVYDASLFPLIQLPFSISQIFQFRYAALCAQNEKAYDHSIVQYFHSLMKSQDPIFNLKHIPNSIDRQQILPIFQSLIYIPTIFGISCRNNDTPSIISDISSLVAQSAYIRSIKLMNCNASSDLDTFSQAISSNKQLPLEELYLNDNEFEDLSPLINSLYNLQSQMKCLSLSDCGLDDSSLDLLGNCLLYSQSMQNLKYLGIGGTEFKENSVKNIIKYIQKSSQLSTLDLSGSKYFSSILKSIPGSSITDLNLSDCIFDDESVAQLNNISQFITTLNISGCDLNFYEVSDIISKLGKKLNSLVSIKLNGLNFSKDRSFAILRGFLLTDLDKWKSIEMNDTQISSNELFAYQALFLRMNHLEHLAFNSNFKEEDAKCVASLFEIKSLKSISLANCHLASIIPNIIKSKINVVNLSNNDLNDQEALNILSAPNLTSVKLNDNSFRNFEKIVQAANENPRLNEPPLKHGLSTIHRNSPYSKDLSNIISKYNVDKHTALSEDLQFPYPFTQKDHEEEVLQLGDPSTYNLEKLNCVAIENNSSPQELKMVDINPEIEILKNPDKTIPSSKFNDSTSTKNRKNDSSSISSTGKKKNNRLSNNAKKNNSYDNNYSSDDQYNYDNQKENKKINLDDYEYENNNNYDSNGQYEIENQYDDESQYDEDIKRNKANNKEFKNQQKVVKNKSKESIENDDILALMESPVIEQTEHKQSIKKSRNSYDASNSESITQQNFHHKMPPPLEEDMSLASEDSESPKPNKFVQETRHGKNEINNEYSDMEEEENWNIESSEINNGNIDPRKIMKFTENLQEGIVNSSSTMKSSSASPSPKSQKSKPQSKYNTNQYDEDPSDENDEDANRKTNSLQKSGQKQKSFQIKSKYDVDEDEEEEIYNNNMNKKRDDFIQGFRKAMFTSENSENEEQEKANSSSSGKRKQSINSLNEDEKPYSNLNNNDDHQKYSQFEESEDEKNVNKINKNPEIVEVFEATSSDEIEIEDEDGQNYYSKNNKNTQNDRSSKSQKSSRISTPTSNNSRKSNIEKDNLSSGEEESNFSQKQQSPQKRKSRIPSPFELRQSSPSKRNTNEITSEVSSTFKSKIPGPRSPQRSTGASRLPQQQEQQEPVDQNDQQQNQRIPRRVLFDSDETENENKEENLKTNKNEKIDQNINENENGNSSKLMDSENVINNLNLSSNEEPMIHKNANSIPDRHPSLSDQEEAFIRMRRMRLPRKVLNQSDESDNYNDTDTFSISSNSFSPQHQQPPSPPIVPDIQDNKKKAENKKPKKSFSNENDDEDLIDMTENTSFIIPKAPEPAAEESLSSAYDFIALTSILFSMPKKKPHNNQISPLILAFSPPFLEDE